MHIFRTISSDCNYFYRFGLSIYLLLFLFLRNRQSYGTLKFNIYECDYLRDDQTNAVTTRESLRQLENQGEHFDTYIAYKSLIGLNLSYKGLLSKNQNKQIRHMLINFITFNFFFLFLSHRYKYVKK